MNLNGNFDKAFQTFSINNWSFLKRAQTTTKVAFFFKRKINIAILYNKKIF